MIMTGCSSKEAITESAPPQPYVELYFDLVAWHDSIVAHIGNDDDIIILQTTAANVALSNEVVTPPSANTGLGPVITFDSAITGFPFSFHLACLQAGAGITFDDREGSDLHQAAPVGYQDRTLSIGDTDDREDDDFEIVITACNENYKVYAIGIEVIDNAVENGEYIAVQCVDSTQDTIFAESPDCPGTGVFMGIVSNQELLRLMLNENASGDDLFVRDFYFAVRRK